MTSRDDPDAPQPQGPAAAAGAKPRRIKVSELLDGGREAILEHGGQDYRLRITANGKLILTK
jgi:hemin uptake protein HemP